MSEFDSKANDWDKNAVHLERSKAIAAALSEMISLQKDMKALEFGAGTGLLSFILRDRVSGITLVDSSREMIRIAQAKIEDLQAYHMKTLLLDLEKENLNDKFDLICNQMVFHHVIDIELLIRKFYTMLNDGGYLAIADLYPEDGSFHGDGFTGHKGFDINTLSAILTRNGFGQIKHKPCFVQLKMDTIGKVKEYPVFLMVTQK